MPNVDWATTNGRHWQRRHWMCHPTSRLMQNVYENRKQSREWAHAAKEEEQTTVTSFAQKVIICHCCGKKEHRSLHCNQQDSIPRNDWCLNKDPQNMQNAKTDGRDEQSVQCTRSNTSHQHHRSSTPQRKNSTRIQSCQNNNRSYPTMSHGMTFKVFNKSTHAVTEINWCLQLHFARSTRINSTQWTPMNW